LGTYAKSKGTAERIVRDADNDAMRTVVVRPCAVWGPGDRTLVPTVGKMAKIGFFAWIAGGHFPVSTSHVTNLVEGLLLAAEKGTGGAAYFLTDGAPVDFRWFLTGLLAAHGVTLPERELGYRAARGIAVVSEWAWRTLPLPGAPPLSPEQVYLAGHGNTATDAKARAELGYAPAITVEDGIAQLAALNR
jgi:nucleoside-diphosphate-sugar epimerase